MTTVLRGSDNFDTSVAGQTWASYVRVAGTPYTNDTDAPIWVNAVVQPSGNVTGNVAVVLGGVTAFNVGFFRDASYLYPAVVMFSVQPGETYQLTITGAHTIPTWAERS